MLAGSCCWAERTWVATDATWARAEPIARAGPSGRVSGQNPVATVTLNARGDPGVMLLLLLAVA
jgi:hypothetical protein